MKTASLLDFPAKKTLLFILVAWSMFIVGSVFINLSHQLDPGFRYKPTLKSQWQITQSDYSALKKDTIISHVKINDKTYPIKNNWLKQTLVNVRSDAELDDFFKAEAFLYQASSEKVSLVDTSGNFYPITFAKRSWRNTTAYFFLYPLLASICVYIAIWAAYIGDYNKYHGLNIIGSILFSLTILLSVSGMDRLWAVSPDWFYYQFYAGNLTMRLYICAYFLVFWNTPYEIFKHYTKSYIFFYLLVFIMLSSWLCQFTGLWKNFDLLIIKVIFLIAFFALVSFFVQWYMAYKSKQKSLVNQIAMRWMLATIGVCLFCGFGYNIMWQIELASGEEADLINSFNVLVYKMGVVAILLKHLLYRMETWWWRAWGVFGAMTTGLISLIVQEAFLSGFNQTSMLISILIMTLTYLTIGYYFRYRYSKNNEKVMDRVLPDLINVVTSFNQKEQASFHWHDVLEKTYMPQKIDIVSKKVLVDRKILTENQSDIAYIHNEGEQLLVKGLSDSYIMLTGSLQGMRLFTKRDVARADAFWKIASQGKLKQEAFLEGETAERKRIAADLHDDIGGKLLYLSSVEGNYGQYAQETLQDLRTLTRGLGAEDKALDNLLADLNYQLAERCEVKEVEYLNSFDIADDIASQKIPARSATMLSSMLSELLRNALQHNNVTFVSLTIKVSKQTMRIEVSNDGDITDPKVWQSGLGTVSMKRRVNDVKGNIDWLARAGGGVDCTITWQTPTWLGVR